MAVDANYSILIACTGLGIIGSLLWGGGGALGTGKGKTGHVGSGLTVHELGWSMDVASFLGRLASEEQLLKNTYLALHLLSSLLSYYCIFSLSQLILCSFMPTLAPSSIACSGCLSW